MKIYIVYDSEVGHTEKLARSIAKGAKNVEGTEVFIHHVNNANVRDLAQMDAIIWGCPGHFGTISSGLKAWIDKLGSLWAEGNLVDKIGAVFCTTATVHGGIEATLLNLITPMLHQGMMVVGLPASIPGNAFYGSYYGIGVTSPDEDTDDELSHSLYEKGILLGESLGTRVANMTKIFLTGRENLSRQGS
ncbi:NAD(P)H-dependent oxidoreductase [Paenibacillus sp. CGMCC 1.16610]|uniref:Flavodoxin family protein n=1 Tax=Paenibacillus anseongense TaxID=2682845 RepID=A0ABW9U2M5_9BACL|nr:MULTISPECIES: NAD(P)H-dependent oxidoreductase [Paenibacillus]MBA2936966.1 NAD(P)H-dependent oxidoreductase [Paenibacillus sp. CGMCC 1.16610]MVQ33291.1 flavodoxin family protein [Paenibacillus anseongense]